MPAAPRTPAKDASATNQDSPGSALAPIGAPGAVALPAALQERLAGAARDQAAAERPSISKISLRGGVMSYEGQMVKDNKLPCVVLFVGYRNAFYNQPFDSNNLANPVCFAVSEDGEDMEAHENVPDSNVPKADPKKERPGPRTCEGCEMNAWGSDFLRPGSRGKACKEGRRAILLPASALESAEAVAKAELAVMDLPVTSGANYRNFVNGLAAAANVPPWAALTTIEVVRDPKTQFKVTFTPTNVIQSEEILLAVEKRIDQAKTLALTPYDEVASTVAGKMVEAQKTKF